MESRKTKSLQDLVESVQPLSHDEQGKLLGGFTDASIGGNAADGEINNNHCSGNGDCVGNETCHNNKPQCWYNTLCVQKVDENDDDSGPVTANPCKL